MTWLDLRVMACDDVSWFQQRHRVYAYHDAFGYLMELSPDLLGVFQAFIKPTTPRDVLEHLHQPDPRGLPPIDLIEEVIQTWIQHKLLVDPYGTWRQELASAYPVRARWHIAHDNGDSITAIVGRNIHTPPRALEFTPMQAQIWRLIDGNRSIIDIANNIDGTCSPNTATVRAVQDTIAAWTHSEVQLTRLSNAPMRFYSASKPPAYLISSMPYTRITPDAPLPYADPDSTDLHAYHTDVIDDAQHQFDDVETTLAHLFRLPTPFLGELTYGESFADALMQRDLLNADTRDVLEVGGGIGVFARALLDRLLNTAPHLYQHLTYTVLDLSPALHRSQTHQLRAHPTARTLLGDALNLPYPDSSIDLIVCNEVIADLPCHVLTRLRDVAPERAYEDPDAWLLALEEDADDDPVHSGEELSLHNRWSGPADVLDLLDRFGVTLDDAPAQALVNTGAIRFLLQIKRVLKPNSAAILTEFGHPHAYPQEADHLDHPEVSIHFGILAQVARRLGLLPTLVQIPELLPLDLSLPSIASTQTYWRNLRALAVRHGASLPKIAYTPDSFARQLAPYLDADTLHPLYYSPLGTRTHGLNPHDFYALILRAPI